MEIAARELLLDLISGPQERHIIPDFLAADEEVVDWLFYLLHSEDYPPHEVFQFLFKHRSEDPRFLLWKNRAFRPGYFDDGMSGRDAYRFIEKHEPGHPWLDPFMEQAAYSFCDITGGPGLAKEFRRHLKTRFDRRVGTRGPEGDVTELARRMDSAGLVTWIADSGMPFKNRLAAVIELFDRNEFDFIFEGDFDFSITDEMKHRALDRITPALLAAASKALARGGNYGLAFEILLKCCPSPEEFMELFDRALELNYPGAFLFLPKLEEFGDTIPPDAASRILRSIASLNRYSRRSVTPLLLARAGDAPEVIACIKAWATGDSDAFELAGILSMFLDRDQEQGWVRETALEFQRQHDESDSLFDVIARIGDEECIFLVLTSFDSSLSAQESSAIDAAGYRLHRHPGIRNRLLEKARAGHIRALHWIACRYPQDPAVQEILDEATRLPGPGKLVRTMCFQEILLPKLRERFVKALADPSTSYPYVFDAILAVRSERESLAREIRSHWEKLSFCSMVPSGAFPMWFSWEPLMDQVMAKIRSGDLLKDAAELIIDLSGFVDVSEALCEGIRAASDKFNLDRALQLLGLIYGDRPETIPFFQEFIEWEPAMMNYGAETAFAEVIRLGKRGEEDFAWALATLRNSSQRRSAGIAHYGPKILVHFFGSGERVVQALQEFAMSSSHPPLASASTRLLMDAFPNKLPGSLRAAVEAMPVEGRMSHVLSLRQNASRWISELVHFTLHDPDASIRKEAMSGLARSYNMPGAWRDPGFATACLQHAELAGMAATLLAKWSPEDETVARELVEAASRFPDAEIPLILAASFGNTASARKLMLEQVREFQKVAAGIETIPRCTCRRCVGFDAKQYAAMMLRLHHPPFDQDPEAKELVRDIVHNPWLESCNQWQFLGAITFGLDDAGKLARYEEIIRTASSVNYREWACNALANMAGKNEAALETLLRLLEDPDESLRKLAARFSSGISHNERRNHRGLHDLLKAIKGG